MTNAWDYATELARFERGSFTLVIDKTYEETSISSYFDDYSEREIIKMQDKVNRHQMDWFMVRVRVYLDTYVLGSAYMPCNYYKDAKDFLKETRIVEEMVHEAIEKTIVNLKRLKGLIDKCDIPATH